MYVQCLLLLLDLQKAVINLDCPSWSHIAEEYSKFRDFAFSQYQVGPRVAEVQNLQSQQEHKAVAERAKVESGPQPSDKGKPRKEPNSRSSKTNDNDKTSGRKRGLGYTELENPVKRQKFPKESVKERDEVKASDTPADMDSSMEEAGTCSVMLLLFLFDLVCNCDR